MNMNVGCVGGRNLTPQQLDVCYSIGFNLGKNNINVVSGNALGADYTYAKAASKHNPNNVILFLPWESYNSRQIFEGNIVKAIQNTDKYAYYRDIAELCHPYWDNIKNTSIKNFFARNVAIVDTSDILIAFPSQKGWSGTKHSIKVAEHLKKDVIILTDESDVNKIIASIKG